MKNNKLFHKPKCITYPTTINGIEKRVEKSLFYKEEIGKYCTHKFCESFLFHIFIPFFGRRGYNSNICLE